MLLDADASAQITTTRSARLRMLHTDNGHTIFVVVVADCVFFHCWRISIFLPFIEIGIACCLRGIENTANLKELSKTERSETSGAEDVQRLSEY